MNQSSTSKKFVLGATTGVAGLAIKTILNIIVYPFILHTLGIDHYGLYVLLLNIVELVILMDLGLTSGVVQQLSTFHALEGQDQDAKENVRQTLSVGLILYAAIALVSLCVCFSLIPFVPGFFNLSPELSAIASFCLYVILIESSITLFQGYFSSVLMSHHLYQWVNTSETIYFIIANGGIFVLLHLGYGLQEMALLRLGAAVLKFLLVMFHAVRIEPDCIKPVYFNVKKAVDILKISVHAMIRTISDIFANRMDLVLIGRMLTIRDVAVYEFVYRFLNIIMQIPMHVSAGIFPIFTKLRTLQDDEKTKLLLLRLSCFLFFCVTLMVSVLAVFFKEIFAVFSGGRMSYEETFPLLLIAIPAIVSSAAFLPASHYLFAAGRFRLITVSSTSAALFKLVMVLLFIKQWGLTGVIISTFIMDMVYHQIIMVREACKSLSIGATEYIRSVYFINIPSFIVSFLVILQLKNVPYLESQHPLAHAFLTAVIATIVGVTAWFLTTASSWEKEQASQLKHQLKKWQLFPKNP